MTAQASRIDWLVFLLLGGMWGSSYLFIKIGVETVPPFTLIALRLGIGLALLVAVVAIAREPLPRQLRMYGHLVVMAVVNIVLPFLLITWAVQYVDSALASILNATVPLFVIVIAALTLHDEPITVNRLAGLGIGFAGVVVLTARGMSGGGGDILAEIALVASAVSYAIGGVYSRRFVKGLRPMIPAVFQVGFAFVICTVLALLLEQPIGRIQPSTEAILSIVWLGVLGSGVAYLAFFRLIRNWGATRTSLVAYLLPVVGIALGAVAGEEITIVMIGGTLLVIAGLALVNSRYGTRRLFGRSAPAATAGEPGRAG